MDYIAIQRAEALAKVLNDGARCNDPMRAFFVAGQDEFGRWHIPGLYEASASTETSGTYWRLLAALHNAIDALDAKDASVIAYSIMGQSEALVTVLPDEPDDIQIFAEHSQLVSTVLRQAQLILHFTDILMNNIESIDLSKMDQLKMQAARKTSQMLLKGRS